MRLLHYIREPLLFAAAWTALSYAGLALRDIYGASILLWMPSGVAVAAFHLTPRARWPLLIGVLLPVQVSTVVLNGLPVIASLAYAAGALVQAMVAASLGIRVLGGRSRAIRHFSQVLGIFGAAMAACLIGATLALPLRGEQSASEFFWWFFANFIGIMTVTPLAMRARQLLFAPNGREGMPAWRELCMTVVAFALLSLLVLRANTVALAPALIVGLVFITIRFGHQTSALSVFTFGIVATIISLGGESPAPMVGLSRRGAELALQSWMMLMLATAIPVAAMMMKREELQLELIRRNVGMHENLMLLDLSEQMAGIGRWRLDLVTGEQDWSQRMLEMNGLPADLSPETGDIRPLLPDRGRELIAQLTRNRRARDPYSFDYRVKPPRGTERILRISVLNEFDITGRRIALFGIAMDVTEQVHREQALDLARGRAVRLAAEAQKLANTDPLTSLPNRRCTFSRLKSLVDVATQHGSPLTAIMFDIDFFKAINDTHGHQTGDEVIIQVAELARRQARQGDLVGRIGGEEFVWLLPGVGAGRGRSLAERLRRSVEQGIEGSALPNVTISVGLSEFGDGDSGDDLLARADAALYAAKEGGRNQVRRAA